MKFFFISVIALLPFIVQAQRIEGTVKSDKGEPLPYTSVYIKGSTQGTSANDKGYYIFNVNPGTYTLVCRRIGYATVEKNVKVNGNEKVDFVLQEQQLKMNEVVVATNREDPAYAIIRKAIAARPAHEKELKDFSVDIYTKDLVKLRNIPKSFMGHKFDAEEIKDMGMDSAGNGILYLSENISTYHKQASPEQTKLQVISSRVSGSDGYSMPLPTFISFYSNNVNVLARNINPRGFVSPIADGAIGFYRYKFLGSYFENGKEVNSIRVTPRRKFEPLFSGIIQIVEDEWRIYSVDLMLTKESQIEMMDTLKINQVYVPITPDVWYVKNQHIYFSAKKFGFDIAGNMLAVYSNYNITPNFSGTFFDKVIIDYKKDAAKKNANYWDSVRPMQLSVEELKDYTKKDSSFKAMKDSMKLSRRNADSLNKAQPHYKITNLYRNYSRSYYFTNKPSLHLQIDPILQNVEYNTAEGLVINGSATFSKARPRYKWRPVLETFVRYGLANTHFNSWATLNLYRQDSASNARSTLVFSGGKRVSDYNKASTMSAFVNSLSTLIWGQNYMKTYENYYGLLAYNYYPENGFSFYGSLLYEDRMPLRQSTDFILDKSKKDNLRPNYPYELISGYFNRHQAMIATFSMKFQPGIKYIQFPNYKMPVGSNKPIFGFEYTKGLPVLGSEANFDKWKFTIKDGVNMKLLGSLQYNLAAGGFLNTKNVPIQDYQHFNGNRTLLAGEYLNTYQLAPYYANSTTAKIYFAGHAEHHFNGLITNKIPLFRKLNWNLVGGSNAFYVNKSNNYVELFVGLENIFKVLRVDLVAAYTNGSTPQFGVRIGTGGLIGSAVRINSINQKFRGNFTGN